MQDFKLRLNVPDYVQGKNNADIGIPFDGGGGHWVTIVGWIHWGDGTFGRRNIIDIVVGQTPRLLQVPAASNGFRLLGMFCLLATGVTAAVRRSRR